MIFGALMLKSIVTILAVLGGVYVVYAAVVYTQQRSMLFPAPRFAGSLDSSALPPGAERILIDVGDGRTQAWLYRPQAALTEDAKTVAPVLIFAHGNGEVIQDWADLSREALDRGVGLLLVEYPGYGFSGGKPSQQSIQRAMVAAYDALVKMPWVNPKRVFAYGRSLGGGAVLALSLERPLAGLVLQSTFASVREFARGFLVPGFLVRDPFDNVTSLRRFGGPVMIFHGERDPMIPFSHAEKLAEAAQGARLVPMQCAHNDCPPNWGRFWEQVFAFVLDDGRTQVHSP